MLGGGITSSASSLSTRADQLALVRLARHDRLGGQRRGPLVEPQLGLAPVLVGAVARVAVVREDRPDVPVELDPGALGGPAAAGARSRDQPGGRDDEATIPDPGVAGPGSSFDLVVTTTGISPIEVRRAPVGRRPPVCPRGRPILSPLYPDRRAGSSLMRGRAISVGIIPLTAAAAGGFTGS